MLNEKLRNELKKAVATFIIRTPFAEEKEWYDLYNDFILSDKKYIEEDFGPFGDFNSEDISYEIMKMIKDAQYKRCRIL